MHPSFPKEAQNYFVEAHEHETQPAMQMFWMNLVRWHLGDNLTVEEEDAEDAQEQGTGRRAFAIFWNGEVQMTAQTSRLDDVDAETIAAQTAQNHLDMAEDTQIFVLNCQGIKCNLLRVWTDNGEVHLEVTEKDIEPSADGGVKLMQAFAHGFANRRISCLKTRINS